LIFCLGWGSVMGLTVRFTVQVFLPYNLEQMSRYKTKRNRRISYVFSLVPSREYRNP
jgi:hypothetical protein